MSIKVILLTIYLLVNSLFIYMCYLSLLSLYYGWWINTVLLLSITIVIFTLIIILTIDLIEIFK